MKLPALDRDKPIGSKTYRLCLGLVFAIGLFGYPAVLNTALAVGMDSRAVTVPFRLAFAMLAGLVFVGSYRYRVFRLDTNLALPLAIFIVLYTIRICYDNTVGVPFLRRTLPDYLGSLYVICVIPAMAFAVSLDNRTAKRTFNFTLLIGLFVAGTLVFSYKDYLGTSFGRLKGFGGQLGPIIIAKYGCALILMGAYGLMTPKVQAKTFTPIASAGVCAGGFVMMILGGSRGPALAMMFGMALLTHARFRGKTRTRVILLLMLLSLATPFLLEKIAESGSSLIRRLTDLDTSMQGYGMESSRIIIWKDYIAGYLESPIFGRGLEAKLVGIGHNLILDSFYNTGFFGGILFAFVYLSATFKAWKILIYDEYAGWIGLYYCYFAAHCMVSEGIYYVASWWFGLLFVIAYPNSRLRKVTARSGR